MKSKLSPSPSREPGISTLHGTQALHWMVFHGPNPEPLSGVRFVFAGRFLWGRPPRSKKKPSMYTTLLIWFPNQQLLSSPEGILQTVCCLAPNKSFSERFRKGNLAKATNLFLQIFSFLSFIKKNHQVGHMSGFLLKVPTKISHTNYFENWGNWFITSLTILNVIYYFWSLFEGGLKTLYEKSYINTNSIFKKGQAPNLTRYT